MSVEHWTGSLQTAINTLGNNGRLHPQIQQDALTGIDEWDKNIDHGRIHADYVYRGMLWLAKEENLEPQAKLWETAATLHDLGQFLPLRNILTNENNLRGNNRLRHEQMLAVLVRRYGSLLDLSPSDCLEAAAAIRHHDDVFLGVTRPNLSDTAKLLSDADKLFGSSENREPAILVNEIIFRSYLGQSGENGWHLLRDYTREQRDHWRYGDRWASDGLSAIRRQFRMPYYTTTAQKLAKSMREIAPQIAADFYGKVYETTQATLSTWGLSSIPDRSIFLIGKDQRLQNVTDQPIPDIINHAYHKPLKLAPEYTVRGDTYGWKIKLVNGDVEQLIDPSIARFPTQQTFLTAIEEALT